ncbi:hypothetical protein EMCRGX_G001066 [Ephydatia muelleri]
MKITLKDIVQICSEKEEFLRTICQYTSKSFFRTLFMPRTEERSTAASYYPLLSALPEAKNRNLKLYFARWPINNILVVEAVQHFLFGIAIDEGCKGPQANTLAWDVLYPELMITLLQRMNHSPETSYEQSAIHYIKHLMS